MSAYHIAGKAYPIAGYQETDSGKQIPILGIPMTSAESWDRKCLESRLAHPERYAPYEDVAAVIAQLREKLEGAK